MTRHPGHPRSPAEVDLFDPATQEDWIPTYDLLLEEAPVWQMLGTDTFVVTRYEDIGYVLRRTETFARGASERTPGRGMSARTAAIYAARGWPRIAPLAVDPPVHRRYREIVDPFFPVQGAARQRDLIAGIIDGLIDAVAARGEMEYVTDVAVPLPVRVITTMMGFRLEDIPQLKVWSEAWVLPFRGRLTDEEEVYAGERGVEFQHHIHATIQDKRDRPDDSVISFLANDARFGGERPLTDAEIIGMADHLYIGGNETTTFAMASGLWLLLSNPDAHATVGADRSRVRDLVEEVLRLESPTMGMVRTPCATPRSPGWRSPRERASTSATRRPTATRASSPTRTASTSTGPTRRGTSRSRSARSTAPAPACRGSSSDRPRSAPRPVGEPAAQPRTQRLPPPSERDAARAEGAVGRLRPGGHLTRRSWFNPNRRPPRRRPVRRGGRTPFPAPSVPPPPP